MRQFIEQFRRRYINVPRLLVVLLSLLGLLVSMTAAFTFRQVIIIREDGSRQILLTSADSAEEILEAAGIDPLPNDEVIYRPDSPSGSKLYINSSFDVPLLVDGGVRYLNVVEGTVADVLLAHQIELGALDIIEPATSTELYRGIEVVVRRVELVENTRRVEVLDADVEAYLATLPEEEQKSFTRSKSRIYDAVFKDRLEDGLIAESEILALTAVYHPYDPPLQGFTRGVACSTIDGFAGISLDVNGIPSSYSYKIEGAICTAYSAPAGGLGAGGQGLYCGTVAVDPTKIAYGTRLYIAAADGSFIYGYAIASDCGTAMMDGRVDFDLFFETYEESCWFGKRWLDVYVLD